MFARVSEYAGDAARLDAFGAEATQAVAAMEPLAAFRGGIVLGDRRSGRALAITLWATETALLATTARGGDSVRDRLGERSVEPTVPERWEVLASHFTRVPNAA
jgi:hypothetical protein